MSFSQERKQSDSEMSTDTDGRTPDTDVTDTVSDTEEEEKSGSARRRWKIGIGKVGIFLGGAACDWDWNVVIGQYVCRGRNSWNCNCENEKMLSLWTVIRLCGECLPSFAC